MSFTRYAVVVLSLCLLAGCASPTKVGLVLEASEDLNPDPSGRPSPVVVRVFELRGNRVFDHASFANLTSNPSETLGDNLIKDQEIELLPEAEKDLDWMPDAKTEYLGIIAEFRDIETAVWRLSKRLIRDDDNDYRIRLEGNKLSIVPPKSFWKR